MRMRTHVPCMCARGAGRKLHARRVPTARSQGLRQLEIDCWDGRGRFANTPIVTHGHTFCTIEKFSEVAKAIGQCAFATSEMPVLLSLEVSDAWTRTVSVSVDAENHQWHDRCWLTCATDALHSEAAA
eukprot:4176484-Prymnesium_polylepis.1